MDQDARNAELSGDGACMLTSSTSENAEDVVFWVEATRLGQGTDGSAHGLIGHSDEAKGYFID